MIRFADEGDSVAKRLKDESVGDLRRMLYAAVKRLGDDGPHVREVAMVGGLVKPGRPLRAEVEQVVRDLGLTVIERDVVPERGAAALARQLVP